LLISCTDDRQIVDVIHRTTTGSLFTGTRNGLVAIH